MPLALIGLALGALLGAVIARRRGGNVLDMLQYGAALGILCALAGLFIAIAIARIYG